MLQESVMVTNLGNIILTDDMFRRSCVQARALELDYLTGSQPPLMSLTSPVLFQWLRPIPSNICMTSIEWIQKSIIRVNLLHHIKNNFFKWNFTAVSLEGKMKCPDEKAYLRLTNESAGCLEVPQDAVIHALYWMWQVLQLLPLKAWKWTPAVVRGNNNGLHGVRL